MTDEALRMAYRSLIFKLMILNTMDYYPNPLSYAANHADRAGREYQARQTIKSEVCISQFYGIGEN